MSDMSFLDGGSTKIVSTGNTKAKVTYDTSVAHIEQDFTIPLETPYVKRAIKHAEGIGFAVVGNLRQALELRANEQKVLSYREADILLRQNFSGESTGFFWEALFKFCSFFTEDDSKFTSQIYVLRARYNKGLAWLASRNPDRPRHVTEQGIERLAQIKKEIEDRNLPLHDEEIVAGFHQEFLKPEYLAWRQYMNLTSNPASRSISEKQEPSFSW